MKINIASLRSSRDDAVFEILVFTLFTGAFRIVELFGRSPEPPGRIGHQQKIQVAQVRRPGMSCSSVTGGTACKRLSVILAEKPITERDLVGRVARAHVSLAMAVANRLKRARVFVFSLKY